MTLILKAKTTATGLVGNIHGNTGPQDYVAMLDFARGEYFTKSSLGRTDYAVGDVISVTRASTANYQDRYGVWRKSEMNAPRYRYSEANDAYGLFIDHPRTNLAPSAANGAPISIPAASLSGVILSWEGSGDVSLLSSNLALAATFTTRGRKVKAYTRSVTSAFTDALGVTGSVDHVQVESAPTGEVMAPSERLSYGASTGIDLVELRPALLNLIGPDGTLILRTVDPDGYRASSGTQSDIIALKTGFGQGGLYLRQRYGLNVAATQTLSRIENGGAIGSGATVAEWTATGRPSGIVHGVAWEEQGAKATGMTGGMFLSATGGAALGQFVRVKLGHDAESHAGNRLMSGIITHCVIYDRHLTYDEMSVMATMWQN